MMLQAVEDRVRMPVAVLESRGNHREGGRTASRNSSVLEVRLPWCATFSTSARGDFAGVQHLPLDLPLHVAAEQEAARP